MLDLLKNPFIWVNAIVVFAAAIAPSLKDILTPELAGAMVLVLNAGIALVQRYRAKA